MKSFNFQKRRVMQNNHNNSKRCSAPLARGFAALCAALIMAAPAGASAAPVETVLHAFTGYPSDGAYPYAGLIADSKGNLYGTTNVGGASYCSGGGCGTVFALSPPASAGGAWTKTVLHSFGGNDGSSPQAGLIVDSKGNLYGTTNVGGASNAGTVFKLAPPASAGGAWTETVLYSFMGGSDGSNPVAGLIFDASGALYGTTSHGGPGCAPNYAPQGCGTVFKLTPPASAGGAWTETVLYGFRASDGWYPAGGVIFDNSGALYGTTGAGGTLNVGTVFKLTPPASVGGDWSHTVLYNFTGYQAGLPSSNPDGAGPSSSLIFDNSGALYGTTQIGGTSGRGTVFKVTPPASAGGAWTETVLYTFMGSSDGGNPQAGLISNASGALFGTTYHGGIGCVMEFMPPGCGTVFKLAPPASAGGAWTETALYSFAGGTDGAFPYAGLIADSMGNLYGTTLSGGTSGQGTVFEVTGSGFVPVTFAGTPGKPDCYGQSVSALAKKYGGLDAAAAALGYSSVTALQNAITAYCRG
jgi:uncharacterized repeat protein (TIGR03803 family)